MFKLHSKYKPAGDQPEAIAEILDNLKKDHGFQTLWWVTGSGKTFTMANVVEAIQKPTLVIAHNKTLAAQLAQEFKEFFPWNAVHYFVSYYDYYQPEAYVSKTDTYIEKEATINEEIDRLRHAATQDLLTRKDVLIVASVSCIYGLGDIQAYSDATFDMEVGKEYKMEDILKKLVSLQYKRAAADFKPWTFQVMGDLLEIFPASKETVVSIEFWGDEVSQISDRNYMTGEVYERMQVATIFPAKHTVTTSDKVEAVLPEIKKELEDNLKMFQEQGDVLKYERLKAKVEYDIEMIQEVGYVNGIENYSRYFDRREPGQPPTTLMDFFPKDSLTFVDESHMTFSQVGWMYAWDRARKENLVMNGFRLPSSFDNRPLQFDEFESKINHVIAVSATPSKYEIGRSSTDPEAFFTFKPKIDGQWQASKEHRIVPQAIRPTGLLDPKIEMRSMEYMVDDIQKNIDDAISTNNRILITTITKRSSEELTDFLLENGVAVKYLHSEVDTLERLDILKELREGKIDVIVWVNLLREWLDLPEVSKICILDADKQWFLRSESALIQITGRAARNSDGTVYMYSERVRNLDFKSLPKEWALYRLDNWKLINEDGLVVSEAMRKAIELTYYRRWLQEAHNENVGMTPTTVYSSIKDIGIDNKKKEYKLIDKKDFKKEVARLELEMDIASANMEYEKAAELRDALAAIKAWKKKGR